MCTEKLANLVQFSRSSNVRDVSQKNTYTHTHFILLDQQQQAAAIESLNCYL